MKTPNVCVIKLPGVKNYAVVSPGRIVYGLNACEEDMRVLVEEEMQNVLSQSGELLPSPNTGAKLSWIPTFDCNLRCVYCYALGGETKEYLPLEYAVASLRAVGESKGFDYLDIYLVGGGEPLLGFETVKEGVQLARAMFEEVAVHVVTNGTFDEAVFEWLVEQDANVRVSYDGPFHTLQRPYADGSSSWETVRGNIKRLVVAGFDSVVQCIVTAQGVVGMRSVVDDIVSLGVQVVKMEPMLSTDVSRSGKVLVPKPKVFARALLDVVQYVVEHGLNVKVDTGFFTEPSAGYYCGMPRGNIIVTPHGLITSCVEVARPSDPYADLVVCGKISELGWEIYEERREKLAELHFNKYGGGCSRCNFRLLCQGGCPMANIWQSGLPVRKSAFTCSVEHELLPKLLLMLAENPHIADVIMEDVEVEVC
ncbi:radical SAM protein [Patescibacteria group bacterium]|nr:radical SAM protein [Patescibacteria group bacterium]